MAFSLEISTYPYHDQTRVSITLMEFERGQDGSATAKFSKDLPISSEPAATEVTEWIKQVAAGALDTVMGLVYGTKLVPDLKYVGPGADNQS